MMPFRLLNIEGVAEGTDKVIMRMHGIVFWFWRWQVFIIYSPRAARTLKVSRRNSKLFGKPVKF